MRESRGRRRKSVSIRGKREQRGGGQVGERKEMEGRRNANRTKGVRDGEK